jgi:hypothetical protein
MNRLRQLRIDRLLVDTSDHPPVAGECFGCDCLSHDYDFEIEPMTSRLIRKPDTCRRTTTAPAWSR